MSSYSFQSSIFAKTIYVAFAFTFITLLDVVHGSSDQSVIDANLLTEKIGTNRTIVVDLDGQGDFDSIQAAIDSVPNGNSNWIIIHLRKGIYR